MMLFKWLIIAIPKVGIANDTEGEALGVKSRPCFKLSSRSVTTSPSRVSMLSIVEKHSQFIGTYYCVYLDDWLLLQTKSAPTANKWLKAQFSSRGGAKAKVAEAA